MSDLMAATGVVLELKLDREIDQITFEQLLQITGDIRTFALTAIAFIFWPMMTAHGVLFLVIFAIALDRGGAALPHPCPGVIADIENGLVFLPLSWRAVGAAIEVWLSMGLLTWTAFMVRRSG